MKIYIGSIYFSAVIFGCFAVGEPFLIPVALIVFGGLAAAVEPYLFEDQN